MSADRYLVRPATWLERLLGSRRWVAVTRDIFQSTGTREEAERCVARWRLNERRCRMMTRMVDERLAKEMAPS